MIIRATEEFSTSIHQVSPNIEPPLQIITKDLESDDEKCKNVVNANYSEKIQSNEQESQMSLANDNLPENINEGKKDQNIPI